MNIPINFGFKDLGFTLNALKHHIAYQENLLKGESSDDDRSDINNDLSLYYTIYDEITRIYETHRTDLIKDNKIL